MNESLEVQASPGSLSSTNPRDTGPTASSTTESRQQPPMESVSPVRAQSQIDFFRKERQRATTRQSAHPTITTDSGEVHLFLCHRSPAANGLPQISSAYEGVFRNVEAAINHASQASIPADIVLAIPKDVLEAQAELDRQNEVKLKTNDRGPNHGEHQ